MKKLLAIVAVSIFALSACGGSSTSTPAATKPADSATSTTKAPSDADKTANFVDFYAEFGCALAKYSGEIPAAEEAAISSKYGFSNDDDLGKIVNSKNKADVIAKILPKIEAKCLDSFTNSGVDPKGFLDTSFEQY